MTMHMFSSVDEIGEIDLQKEPKPTNQAGKDSRQYLKEKGKSRAPYWEDYNRYRTAEGEMRARRKHCKITFACDYKRVGNKNLKNYWVKCEMNPKNQTKGKGKQT